MPDITEIITRRLASGRRLPRIVPSLTKGWAGIGVSQIRSMTEPGPQMSPTEFGYRTIVWLGRVMVVVRRKEWQ
jgi:hypothetical protein